MRCKLAVERCSADAELLGRLRGGEAGVDEGVSGLELNKGEARNALGRVEVVPFVWTGWRRS